MSRYFKHSGRADSGAARADSGAGKAGMAKNRSGPSKILIHQVLVLIYRKRVVELERGGWRLAYKIL